MARMPTTAESAASRAFRRTVKGSEQAKAFDPTERRHPRFDLFEKHWRFLYESYVGGPEYLYKGINSVQSAGIAAGADRLGAANLFKYFKEGPEEYVDRMLRSHRTNYVRKVVDQIRSFVAKKPPIRRTESAGEVVRRFWKNADGAGRGIDRVMSTTMQWAEVFGVVWMHVDKPREEFAQFEEELDFGMPYVRHYFPHDVLDAGFTDRGVLKWIMVRDCVREDDDPLKPPKKYDVYTVWDRERFIAFRKVPRGKGDKTTDGPAFESLPELSGVHGLGIVPFHPVRFSESDDQFVAPGLADDVAYLDRDIFNKQSQLDTIVLDQTFSQLVMPTDSVVMNDPSRAEEAGGDVAATNRQEEARKRIIEMGTKRVFLFNGNTQHPPKYISPDATQVEVIRNIIKDEITEIYRIAGLLGEVGREVRTQSGTSKAYDFDRLNKVLAFIASELEFAEWWTALVATRWMTLEGFDVADVPVDLVAYPDDFDISGLLEELDIAVRSEEFDYWSPTARADLRKRLLKKQFPNANDALLRAMYEEVDARLAKEKLASRRGLDPSADPDMDPGRPTSERDPSARGPGGGARGPGAGPPTRPTTQQAGAADRGELDQRPSR